jgi:hypothetical protein
MPSLLSGGQLRDGGSGDFIQLSGAQPQLPATETTLTGFTVVTDELLRTSYRSSLGFLEITTGTIRNQLDKPVYVISTFTGDASIASMFVQSNRPQDAIDLYVEKNFVVGATINSPHSDLIVNGLQIGTGLFGNTLTNYTNQNNIIIQKLDGAKDLENQSGYFFNQSNIVIGNASLMNRETSMFNVVVGQDAITTGTAFSNIAIGYRALEMAGALNSGTVVTALVNFTGSAAEFWVRKFGYTYTHAWSFPGTHYSTGTFAIGNTIILTSVDTALSQVLVAAKAGDFCTFGIEISTSTTAYIGYNIFGIYNSNGAAYTAGQTTAVIRVQSFTPQYNGLYVTNVQFIDRTLVVDQNVHLSDRNIAIGRHAGKGLLSGSQNFFLGDNAASNLVYGNRNWFIGHEVANYITSCSNCISIGGDNLINGRNDQISIGSIFYYNGDGYLELNGSVGLGLGHVAELNDLEAGALGVNGGVAISENLIVYNTSRSISIDTGSVIFQGGVGVAGNMYVGELITGVITDSINLVGGTGGSIPFQGAPDTTLMLPIGPADYVLTSDGTIPYWKEISTSTATLYVSETLPEIYDFLFTQVLNTTTKVLYSNQQITFNANNGQLVVPSTLDSTSKTTGAVVVSGGVGVTGSIHSNDGEASEGYLLYVPRVFVQDTPPVGPRVGEFWYDTINGTQYQYVNDNGNKIWVGF